MADERTWAELLAARARGDEVSAEEVERARTASRPQGSEWARKVAAQAAPAGRERRDGEDWKSALVGRLGSRSEEPPPAA